MASDFRTPVIELPSGACDCHMHVFGNEAEFPFSVTRSYTPPAASWESYRLRASALGLARAVLVQASPYGADNACLLDALRRAHGAARGIVVIDAETAASDLAAMHELGARGVRVTLNAKGSDSVEAVARAIDGLAPRIAPLGWHVQLFASLDSIVGASNVIRRAPVDVVFDHMAQAKVGEERGASFDGLRRLLDTGRCWVKLSGADRITGSDTDFGDAARVMSALYEANPQRVVWGSDWPHTGRHSGGRDGKAPLNPHRSLDDSALLKLVVDALPGSAARRALLSENPAVLYGFAAA